MDRNAHQGMPLAPTLALWTGLMVALCATLLLVSLASLPGAPLQADLQADVQVTAQEAASLPAMASAPSRPLVAHEAAAVLPLTSFALHAR